MPRASEFPSELAHGLLRRVRKIEITTRALVNQVFTGAYRSAFKGQGVEFSEVRPYQHGEDIRTIDWKVTARSGSLHVRRYQEERELSVVLAVDVSASMIFGTGRQSKRELAAELAALLAFSAIRNHDRVGLLLFSDRCEKFIPPHKGQQHGLRVIAQLLAQPHPRRSTQINSALIFLSRALRRRSIVFLLSDFYSSDFTQALKISGRQHDCVAMILNDVREYQLPGMGWLNLADPETGQEVEINTRQEEWLQDYSRFAQARNLARMHFFAQHHVDAINLFTDQSYVSALRQFFARRKQRQGSRG